ncbi:MAG: sugar phosphate isomerase/epimerase [Oscillospiraceae bacterium]|nr:sugar phosphate isomerase/epimerase [Oscillospiraceae bacterium]
MIGLGFSLQSQYSLPIAKVIALLAASGFSAVSPVWSPELDLRHLAACTHAHGMTIQSLHAPRKGIPLLWQPDAPLSSQVEDSILRSINACGQFHIPILVVHGWQGLNYAFPETALDFRAFDRIVSYAEQKGVSIAFENLEGEEYLDALLARYRDCAYVGFCWDSGHDHCYPHKADFLQRFGDRLIMTHLNDNRGLRDPSGIPSGKDDLHFLPFDGNIDWDLAIGRLKSAAKQETLNFEIKLQSKSENPEDWIYRQLSLEQFFQKAGQHARRIGQMYGEISTGGY